jgi:hypothetical protein
MSPIKVRVTREEFAEVLPQVSPQSQVVLLCLMGFGVSPRSLLGLTELTPAVEEEAWAQLRKLRPAWFEEATS